MLILREFFDFPLQFIEKLLNSLGLLRGGLGPRGPAGRGALLRLVAMESPGLPKRVVRICAVHLVPVGRDPAPLTQERAEPSQQRRYLIVSLRRAFDDQTDAQIEGDYRARRLDPYRFALSIRGAFARCFLLHVRPKLVANLPRTGATVEVISLIRGCISTLIEAG